MKINSNEQTGFRGDYFIEIIDTITGKKQTHELKNTLTLINQNIHLAMLWGNTAGFNFDDLNIKYFGFGTSNTPATSSQTSLVNERCRKQVTKKIFESGTNFVESIVSLASTDANFNIREIGVFAGANATSTLNSGIMISRIVVDIDKNENKIINIIRRDSVTI